MNYLSFYKIFEVVGIFLIPISFSNVFPILLLPERFHQNCPADFGHCEQYESSCISSNQHFLLKSLRYYQNRSWRFGATCRHEWVKMCGSNVIKPIK